MSSITKAGFSDVFGYHSDKMMEGYEKHRKELLRDVVPFKFLGYFPLVSLAIGIINIIAGSTGISGKHANLNEKGGTGLVIQGIMQVFQLGLVLLAIDVIVTIGRRCSYKPSLSSVGV